MTDCQTLSACAVECSHRCGHEYQPAGDDGIARCYHCAHAHRLRAPGPPLSSYEPRDHGDLWRQRGIKHWHLSAEKVQRRQGDQDEHQAKWVALLDQHRESAHTPREVLDWALPHVKAAHEQRSGFRSTCYPRVLDQWEADLPTRYGLLTAGDDLYVVVHLEPGLEYRVIARATSCPA